MTRGAILIVDDDPLVVASFAHVLEQGGYRVAKASNGRDALRLLRQTFITCVLLDIFMPDQDGIETLVEVKRVFPGTRVLVMSGGGKRRDYDLLNATLKLGADGVARKPLTATQLLALVDDRQVCAQQSFD